MLPAPENLLTPYVSRRHPLARGTGGGWFDLDDWVGPGHPSGRADIAKLEAILANSGDFPMERFQGPTGYWGGALDQGIRSYQKRNGLKVDGALRPGGPTISHMRDSFANLFDGYAPPTVEDIDAHQNIVGDDNPGTIAWRRPPVDLSQIPGLPEIDQEADASNARLVRAMLRTGDIDGYAPLMRDAIDQGGKNALAEVRDLTAKLDEASPGLGGRFASHVFDGMEKAKRDRLHIKMQGGQPLGTVQVAAGPALFAVPWIAEATAAALGLGTAATGAYAIDQASKNIGKLPGRTPADNENKPTQAPPPALVDVPIDTGHPVETPKASDNVETFPAMPEERRKQIVDGIVEELFPNVLEVTEYEDGSKDYRGDRGLEATHIILKQLKKRMMESDIPDMLEHDGGGSEDADRKRYKKEKTIWNNEREFNRPDGSVRLKGSKEPADSANFNTFTPKKDGTPIRRERLSLDRLKKTLGNDVMDGYPKRQAGEDLAEFTKGAEAFADDLFDRWYKRLWDMSGGR
jgi:peptidoglycan hydrolase-like protein with peptidoglycan-binding domain